MLWEAQCQVVVDMTPCTCSICQWLRSDLLTNESKMTVSVNFPVFNLLKICNYTITKIWRHYLK